MSLDAEKAFDSVRWEYHYAALERFGSNNQLVNCLKALYNSPTARIKINGHLSKTVLLQRGCRQGCPLSPTLFALFLEPLAQAIREDKDMTGVQIGDVEHKICACVDDVLLTLTHPNICIPKLLPLLRSWGSYSRSCVPHTELLEAQKQSSYLVSLAWRSCVPHRELLEAQTPSSVSPGTLIVDSKCSSLNWPWIL